MKETFDYQIFDGTRNSVKNVMWPLNNATASTLMDNEKKLMVICTKQQGICMIEKGDYLLRDKKGNVYHVPYFEFDKQYDIV